MEPKVASRDFADTVGGAAPPEAALAHGDDAERMLGDEDDDEEMLSGAARVQLGEDFEARGALADMAKSLRHLEDVCNPPWMKTMRARQDALDSPALRAIRSASRFALPQDYYLKALGIRPELTGLAAMTVAMRSSVAAQFDTSTAGFGLASVLSAQFADTALGRSMPPALLGANFADTALGRSMPASPLGANIADAVAGTMAASVLGAHFETAQSLGRFMAPFRSIADQLGRALGTAPAAIAWSNNLSNLAASWAHLGPERTLFGRGILSVDEEHDSTALIWNEPEGAADLVAAWLPPGQVADAGEITVEVEVLCMACGGELLSAEQRLAWTGPRKGVARIELVPFCATCFARAQEDPDYWHRILAALDAPRTPLRVLDGEGQGDGSPQGALRLVPSDSTCGSEPSDDASSEGPA